MAELTPAKIAPSESRKIEPRLKRIAARLAGIGPWGPSGMKILCHPISDLGKGRGANANPPARKQGRTELEDHLVRAQHYRDQAAKLRAMAETENDPKSREDLLTLAAQYDGLSREMLERATSRQAARP